MSGLQHTYAEAVTAEIAQVGQGQTVHTIFFGGGTPSLMSPADLALILTAVRTHFTLTPTAEITMEANPGTVNAAYLTAVAQLGINRLSFGVQSAIPDELALLERQHDFAAVVDAVATSRAVGFDNLNLDLIYGLPNQSLASWEKSVRSALALQPEHFSLYCLTIEPGTPMQRWLHNGRISAPDPDLAADQYELAGHILAEHGFEHYEISNWARNGRQCEHNLTYWRNQPYLGLGAGAHGFANGTRYAVVKQPRVYIRRMREGSAGEFPLSAAVADSHAVTPAEAMSDTVITQLRLLQEGLDLTAFADQFGQSLDEAYDGTVSQLIAWGMVTEANGRLRLTENGRFLSNQVFYRFM